MGFLKSSAVVLACFFLAATPVEAQVRILPLGDSITNGGQTYVSYRYELWFDLLAGGYDVEFVGTQTTLNSGSLPNAAWYPRYDLDFDRDHDGYWGARTDEIFGTIDAIAASTLPDIVLVHLGTNDIGQQGAAGVSNADTFLRQIIERLRVANANVTILLAQVIDIGAGSIYGSGADQVAPLNAAIATVASDLDTVTSPVILVDQNTGFDVSTMMQSDELHPNLVGESQMADTWLAALAPLLPAGNPPPVVTLTAPVSGSSFEAPADLLLEATASDPNGSVTEVRFYVDGQLLATDVVEPYEFSWNSVVAGSYTLVAQAEDDGGRSTDSSPVSVTVVPPGQGLPVAVVNPSFELPPLPDFALASGPGLIQGWDFEGTTNTFVGIFNPPAGSYSSAGGNGQPSGADGANVAFLFNDGGPAESVSATQVLSETLQPGSSYVLTVAIGRFLPDQPYSFSTYGGYGIELLAGSTVIASDVDTIDPPVDRFQDAFCQVDSDDLSPSLLGQPLAVRLLISATAEDRSTHFDDVRLTRQDVVTAVTAVAPPLHLRVSPSPFNPVTEIVWQQASAGQVSLAIWDPRGRLVETLVEEHRDRGEHRLSYRSDLASGVYILRLTALAGEVSRKFVVAR